MWAFKSICSGNYVKHRNCVVGASYMFTSDLNDANKFTSVTAALLWLQESVLKNANDCWTQDEIPLRTQCVNGVLTLCEVEQYTPPKYTQWREKKVL